MPSTPPHCYWITGLPSAGKSTLAKALITHLQHAGITALQLDGDELRTGLCSDLGLSESDRRENIRRAGELAKWLYTNRITTVCAFVSPYSADRDRVRALFPAGHFSEIYLATALEVCMTRDAKGLYAQAQQGKINDLTGYNAPYQAPAQPEFTVNSASHDADTLAKTLLDKTNRLP